MKYKLYMGFKNTVLTTLLAFSTYYLSGEMALLGPEARTSYLEKYKSDQKEFGVYWPKLEQNN